MQICIRKLWACQRIAQKTAMAAFQRGIMRLVCDRRIEINTDSIALDTQVGCRLLANGRCLYASGVDVNLVDRSRVSGRLDPMKTQRTLLSRTSLNILQQHGDKC
jgi:hypothetical protein